MGSTLSLFGGSPVRKQPYPLHTTVVDSSEFHNLEKLMHTGNWSGFSGRAGERFLGGDYIKKFELEISTLFKTKNAITFNSATSALHTAIAALDIGPGDEVITTPFTMSASTTCIIMNNAIPVFADINPDTFCIDASSVEKKITKYTKAILTVNIFGQPSNITALKSIAKKYNLKLIEDNSQAPLAYHNGSISGSESDIGILSFNYHKHIQTGEGGAIITSNDELAFRSQLIRNHAEVVIDDLNRDDLSHLIGYNYRLTEIQAAIGIEQLKKIDFFIKKRQELAAYLTDKISEFKFLIPPFIDYNNTHVYYLYPIKFKSDSVGIKRNLFVKAMNSEGIQLTPGYVKPIYLLPFFQNKSKNGKSSCLFNCNNYSGIVDYSSGLCPNAENLHQNELMITNICKFPNSKHEINELMTAVHKILDNLETLKIYEKNNN